MNSNTENPSIEQCLTAFGEITGRADTLTKLCTEAVDHLSYTGTPEELKYRMDQIGGLLCAARDIALVIGYIADQHEGDYKGGAENWFMPPNWHRTAELQETV